MITRVLFALVGLMILGIELFVGGSVALVMDVVVGGILGTGGAVVTWRVSLKNSSEAIS
jgi:hypothetical protein